MVGTNNVAWGYAHWELQTTGIAAAMDRETRHLKAPASGYPTLRHLVALASSDIRDGFGGTSLDRPLKNGKLKSNTRMLPMADISAAADGIIHRNGSALHCHSHLNGSSGDDAASAKDMLSKELFRIRHLVTGRSERQWESLVGIVEDLPSAVDKHSSLQQWETAKERAKQLLKRCNSLGSDAAALEQFVIQSASEVADVAYLRDSCHPVAEAALVSGTLRNSNKGKRKGCMEADDAAANDPDMKGVYEACVREILAADLKTDVILVGLSDVYQHLRQIIPDPEAEAVFPDAVDVGRGSGAVPAALPDMGLAQRNGVKGDASWVPPDQFRRKTTKYWARTCDIPFIQAEIVRHLPILIFGRRQQDYVTAGGESKKAMQQLVHKKTTATSRVTSVYYDTAQTLSTYERRLRREDGSQLVRVRWYGARREGGPGATQKMWVERKTHREPWAESPSIKERGDLEQQHLAAFAAGTKGLPGTTGDNRRQTLLREVQHFLTSTSQEPVLRTSCSRAAFQTTDSADLRVSIDTDLRFTRETKESRGDAWCRSEAVSPGPGASRVFPYAVVEIKTQEGQMQPIWVRDLLDSGMLLAVSGFSKFLHASAILHPSQVARVGVPYWFLPSGNNSVSPATFEEMADTIVSAAQGAAPRLDPSIGQPDRSSRTSRLLQFMRGSSVKGASAATNGGHHSIDADVGQTASLAPMTAGLTPGSSSAGPLRPPSFQDRTAGSNDTAKIHTAADSGRAPEGGWVNGTVVDPWPMCDAAALPHISPPSPRGPNPAEPNMAEGRQPATGLGPPAHSAACITAIAANQQDMPADLPPPQHLHQPGSAPARTGPSAVADSTFLPLWRQHQDTSVLGSFSFGDSTVSQQPSQQLSPGDPWHVSSQPLLEGHSHSAGGLPPWSRLPNVRVAGRSHSSTSADLGTRQQSHSKRSLAAVCFSGSSDGADKAEPGPSNALLPSGHNSQACMQPMQPDGRGFAALPSAATLDALEAMEAGKAGTMGASRPPGSSPAGNDARGTRSRRWRGWQMSPFRKKSKSGKDRNASGRAQAVVRTRVEPKTFFANERTFLSWLQISVLIMFMGLSLLGSSGSLLSGGAAAGNTASSSQKGSKIAGLIIAPVAFVFTLYALFMYKKRTRQIMRREAVRYDDQMGPVLLVVLLTAALVATTIITAKAATL